MQPFLLALFLLGFVLMNTLGAWTCLAFQWPAYVVLAVGGLLGLLRVKKGFRFAPSSLCLLSALLFAGYVGVRAWQSPVEYLARQDLLPLAACVVGYTTFALHVEHPKYRRWFIAVVAVLIVANFAIGVYQSQHDRTWSPYVWLGYARATGQANAGGFFHSENHLAGFLEGTAYFLIAFTLFARTKLIWRMAALFVFMLAAVVLVLTYSRGGVASAGVGGLAFGGLALWLYGRFLGPQFWKYLAAFGALFVLLGGFLAYLCYDFLGRAYGGKGGLFGDGQFRVAYTEMAVRQWRTAPVWGTGARTYEIYAREFTTKPEDWNGAQAVDPNLAHNDYAQLLGDYGAVGFGLGLLVLVTHLGNGLRFLAWYRGVRYERTGDIFSNSLALGLGATTAVVAYTAHSIIDFNLHIPANALLVSALFGLLANPGFESDAPRRIRIPGLKLALTGLAALGAGWTLWLGVRTAPAELAYEQGRTRTMVGDYLGALPYHGRAETADPAHYPNHMAYGTAYVGLAGEAENVAMSSSWRQKAIKQFRAAVAAYPRDAVAHINLAEQLSMVDRDHVKEAEEHYQEAIQRAPALVRFRGRLGFHFLRHGQLDKAVEVWEDAFTRKWHDADAVAASGLLEKIRSLLKPPTATVPAAPAPEATAPAADERPTPDPVPAPPADPDGVNPPAEPPAAAPPARGLLSLPDPQPDASPAPPASAPHR